jgi:hypothetical protein
MSVEKYVHIALVARPLGITRDDVFYTPLPFYHTAAGVIALAFVIQEGVRPLDIHLCSIYTCRIQVLKFVNAICRWNVGFSEEVFSVAILGRLS